MSAPFPVLDPRSSWVSDAWIFGADAGNPLPSAEAFRLNIPPALPFRRLYLAAYCRDDTVCVARATWSLLDRSGATLQEFGFSMGNGAVHSVIAGTNERSLYPEAHPPFTILDGAVSAPTSFRDSTEAGPDCVRFVWRYSRDVQAVCYPIRLVSDAAFLAFRWTGVLTVATAGTVAAFAAAGVLSTDYPA